MPKDDRSVPRATRNGGQDPVDLRRILKWVSVQGDLYVISVEQRSSTVWQVAADYKGKRIVERGVGPVQAARAWRAAAEQQTPRRRRRSADPAIA